MYFTIEYNVCILYSYNILGEYDDKRVEGYQLAKEDPTMGQELSSNIFSHLSNPQLDRELHNCLTAFSAKSHVCFHCLQRRSSSVSISSKKEAHNT